MVDQMDGWLVDRLAFLRAGLLAVQSAFYSVDWSVVQWVVVSADLWVDQLADQWADQSVVW